MLSGELTAANIHLKRARRAEASRPLGAGIRHLPAARASPERRLAMALDVRIILIAVITTAPQADSFGGTSGFATQQQNNQYLPILRPLDMLHDLRDPTHPEASKATPNQGEMGAPAHHARESVIETNLASHAARHARCLPGVRRCADV